MKKENLYEVLGDIQEEYVNEAHGTAKKKARPVWLKWGAIAACLALICAIGIGLAQKVGINQPYTTNLNDGSKITFVQSGTMISNLDIAIVGVRPLGETEASAIFGDAAVEADVGFEENTRDFIYLEGTVDGFGMKVMRADVSPDTVIVGEESKSSVNGVPVSAGYFLTKPNSQGNQTAIAYASFAVGNYTVYLDSSGTKEESKTICNALAEEIQKLIETASLDFSQIK